MEKELVEVNGRKMKVFDQPGGNKGTILGIHGLSGNMYSLEFYRQEFSNDYRFITIDLYGRGDTKDNGTSNDLFQHAEDILALMKKLNLEDVILFGYSMGGFISSIVASKTDKIKGVVLLDGFATMSEHQRPIIEPSIGHLSDPYDSEEQYISEKVAGYANFDIPDSPELRTLLAYEINEYENHWEHKASEKIVRNDWEAFWDVDILEVGQKISQPVLLVIALGDIGDTPPLFLPEHYEETQEAIRNLTVVTSDCNHYTMGFERRDDINKDIAMFLDQI